MVQSMDIEGTKKPDYLPISAKDLLNALQIAFLPSVLAPSRTFKFRLTMYFFDRYQI